MRNESSGLCSCVMSASPSPPTTELRPCPLFTVKSRESETTSRNPLPTAPYLAPPPRPIRPLPLSPLSNASSSSSSSSSSDYSPPIKPFQPHLSSRFFLIASPGAHFGFWGNDENDHKYPGTGEDGFECRPLAKEHTRAILAFLQGLLRLSVVAQDARRGP